MILSRRKLLHLIGTGGVTGLAGCAEDQSAESGVTPQSPTGTPSPKPTNSATATEQPDTQTPTETAASGQDYPWPMYHFDSGNTGYISGNSFGATKLSIDWTSSVGDRILASPAITDSAVIIPADDRNLHALDVDTGETLWRFPWEGFLPSSPALFGGMAYFGAALNLHAIDIETGEANWTREIGLVGNGVTVHDGKLFAGYIPPRPVEGGGVSALDPDSGESVWDQSIEYRIHSSPAVSDDTVVVSSKKKNQSDDNREYTAGGRVSALNRKNGEIRWKFEPPARNDIEPGIGSTPSIDGASVYVPVFWSEHEGQESIFSDADLYSLNLADGQVNWNTNLGYLTSTSVAVGSESVYVCNNDESLYAIDKADGAVQWEVTHPNEGSSPIMTDTAVIAGDSDGQLRAFDPNSGDTLGSAGNGAKINSTPAFAHGSVFIANFAGDVMRIS